MGAGVTLQCCHVTPGAQAACARSLAASSDRHSNRHTHTEANQASCMERSGQQRMSGAIQHSASAAFAHGSAPAPPKTSVHVVTVLFARSRTHASNACHTSLLPPPAPSLLHRDCPPDLPLPRTAAPGCASRPGCRPRYKHRPYRPAMRGQTATSRHANHASCVTWHQPVSPRLPP